MRSTSDRAAPEEFIPTRQTLLSRLKDWNDQESWREFFETYWRLIYRAALKTGLSEAEAQDVVQETVISVAKAMPDFKYDPAKGSFKSWLLQLTRWRITDQFRKRRPEDPVAARPTDETDGTSPIERIPDPSGNALERIWGEEWERNVMEVAMERVKHRVDPKHFQIFDLYVVQHWPARKVASTLRINTGLVYLAKFRVASALKNELAALRRRLQQDS